MAKVVGRVEACYDVEEVEYGKVYRWQPKTLVVKCECGQQTAITPSEDTSARNAERSTRSSSGRICLTDSLKMMKTFTPGAIWRTTKRCRTEEALGFIAQPPALEPGARP